MNIALKSCLLLSIFCYHALKSQNEITFDLQTDQYGYETSWSITDLSNSMIVASGDDYGNNQFYSESIDLPDGNYEFEILDSFGDGICCDYGDGYFQLIYNLTDEIIIEGGDFGTSESIPFVLPYVPPVWGCTDATAINFNPEADLDDGTCLYNPGSPVIGLEQIASGFNDAIIIANAGDDRLFIGEQDGRIKILNSNGSVNATPFLNITSLTDGDGERGLLGLAFHPDYSNNGYFYVNYTNNSNDTRVARYQVSSDPDIADAGSGTMVLAVNQTFNNHNGGNLAFGPDGYLYIGLGDGGDAGDPFNDAQDPQELLGKMLRIDVDAAVPYDIPADNPFIDDPEVLNEIWSIGLRNPWRYSFDRQTGDLWIGDVGQNDREEINFEAFGSSGGLNYGWRCYEGELEYNTLGCGAIGNYTFPIHTYSQANSACSVTGGFVYRGEDYPNLDGLYIYVDYCNGLFGGLTNDNGNFSHFDLLNTAQIGWPTFGEGSDGEMYVSNTELGRIYKIIDPCVDLTNELSYENFELSASNGEQYVWLYNGEFLSGVDSQSFIPAETGTYQSVILSSEGCTLFSNEIEVTSVGINEIANNDLSIWPNPGVEQMSVRLGKATNDPLNISIVDELGREYISFIQVIDNTNTFDIDISGLVAGVYLLNVQGEKFQGTKMFVKQ